MARISKSATNLFLCDDCAQSFQLDVEPGTKASFACPECGAPLLPLRKMQNGALYSPPHVPTDIAVPRKTVQAARRT